VSTPAREVMDGVRAPHHPVPSMALVPLAADRAPLQSAPAKPSNVHRVFYGMGYAALALITFGTAMAPRWGNATFGFYVMGVFGLGLGGLGMLVHVLYRPSMPKLRKGLGAVAALGLTLAAQGTVADAAAEVHAASRIARLQLLADDLSRGGRVRTLAAPSTGWVELNGYHGRLDSRDRVRVDGATEMTLADVLRRDGISRLELVRLLNRLEQSGARRVEMGASYVAFSSGDVGPDLLYVRPGQGPLTPGAEVLERRVARMRPVGGAWYLLLSEGLFE
jgi:hypothetical protein